MDARFLMNFFEVHYWPETGHIIMVNHTSDVGPVVTDIQINGFAHSPETADATFLTALALANAGTPEGELFEHKRNVWRVNTHTMERRKAAL